MSKNLEYSMYLKRNELIKLMMAKKKVPSKLMNQYNLLIHKIENDERNSN